MLDPSTAMGITTTLSVDSSTVTPDCGLVDSNTPTSVSTSSGSLSWASQSLAPAVDENGWLVYQLPESGSSPYGVAHGSGYAWLTDQGNQTLLRLSPSVPAIELEKHTNGLDADTPPGPTIQTGESVTWTYHVTNTGQVPLTAIAVTDDQGVSVSCPLTTLVVDASMVCTATGNAELGQYMNIGSVSGMPSSGGPVQAQDPSHYFGVATAIDLEKHTNGLDADTPPGPSIQMGEPVTWTYHVTNTGDVPLTAIAVTDDQGVVVSCPTTTLAVDASMVCTGAGVAELGQYENKGTVSATTSLGSNVSASDFSHYLGTSQVKRLFLPVALKNYP
jgi:hypothetical protein